MTLLLPKVICPGDVSNSVRSLILLMDARATRVRVLLPSWLKSSSCVGPHSLTVCRTSCMSHVGLRDLWAGGLSRKRARINLETRGCCPIGVVESGWVSEDMAERCRPTELYANRLFLTRCRR